LKTYRCAICDGLIPTDRAEAALSRGYEPRYDKDTCANTGAIRRYREAPLRDWAAEVYAQLRATLGGDADQQDESRQIYGSGIFGYAMDYKPAGERGMVVWQVTHKARPRVQRSYRCRWRSSDSAIVAVELVNIYQELAKGAPRRA
jgi:hypothetical protein